MTEVDPIHFTYGAITPGVAYAVSVTGALLGLMCTTRSRTRSGFSRYTWLLGGGVSIGYTGIWAMHFIAMLGFSVPGSALRYDLTLTVVSGAIAIAGVGAGLAIATVWEGNLTGLIAGGVFTGLGVVAMHYIGMASIQLHGEIGYDPGFVVASIVIAVAAATAALWAALYVEGRIAMLGASLIMGFAVVMMHYTAMAGVHVNAAPGFAGVGSGLDATDFFFPLIVLLGTFTCILALLILLSPSQEELERDHQARSRLRGRI